MLQFSIFIGNRRKHKTTDIWRCANEDQCVPDKTGCSCRTITRSVRPARQGCWCCACRSSSPVLHESYSRITSGCLLHKNTQWRGLDTTVVCTVMWGDTGFSCDRKLYLVTSMLEITPWIDIYIDNNASKCDGREYLVPISIQAVLSNQVIQKYICRWFHRTVKTIGHVVVLLSFRHH